MKGYADIADLPEDERIKLIGERAETGERVGFFVEDDAKANRYVNKLTSQFRVEEVKRSHGYPVGTVLVIVTRRTEVEQHSTNSDAASAQLGSENAEQRSSG